MNFMSSKSREIKKMCSIILSLMCVISFSLMSTSTLVHAAPNPPGWGDIDIGKACKTGKMVAAAASQAGENTGRRLGNITGTIGGGIVGGTAGESFGGPVGGYALAAAGEKVGQVVVGEVQAGIGKAAYAISGAMVGFTVSIIDDIKKPSEESPSTNTSNTSTNNS